MKKPLIHFTLPNTPDNQFGGIRKLGFSCPEVRLMLIADKVQNYKDFMLHHFMTHKRSNQLYMYFHNWFTLLDIDITE